MLARRDVSEFMCLKLCFAFDGASWIVQGWMDESAAFPGIHKKKARVGTALSLGRPSGQFIVGMTNSAPSLIHAAHPQPKARTRSPKNRPVSSSSG
jgi:hypothetical protein